MPKNDIKVMIESGRNEKITMKMFYFVILVKAVPNTKERMMVVTPHMITGAVNFD
jgi:hypothetical protein